MMMIATATAGRTDKRDRASTQNGQSEIVSVFWQQWLEHEKLLYNCCLKLMDWNPTEAEDALSTARLKAWKKVQEFGDSIRNFKAWLIELTRNLCLDIIKKRSRGPVAVENIELAGDGEVLCTASTVASPQMVLEAEEQYVTIRRAVASLPQKQRDTFVLHYYEGLKHQEIADRQEISYNSVCKRISLARQQLETKLRGYFRDEKNLATALEPAGKKSSTPVAQVEKQKIQSDEKKGNQTATVSAARECAPVEEKAKPSLKNGAVSLAHMGSERKEVSANESARSRSQTPVAQVEKPTIQSHDSEGKKTATVSAARKGASVAEIEIASFVSEAMEQKAHMGQKMKEVNANGAVQSKSSTPVAQVEKPTIQSDDSIGKETVTVSAAKECVVAAGEKPDFVKRAVAPWARRGQKIKEVSAKGSARSPSPTPLAIVEKPTIHSGEETRALSTTRERVPVVVEAKPFLVWRAVEIPQLVGQKMKELKNVSGDTLWSRQMVLLPSSTPDETFTEREGRHASLLERLRSKSIGHFALELTHRKKAEQLSAIAPEFVDTGCMVAGFDTG